MKYLNNFLSIRAKRNAYNRSTAKERACHLEELFIRHNGDIFPCCRVWPDRYYKIANLKESNLVNKIWKYHRYCTCDFYKLRESDFSQNFQYNMLNIEFGLKCQADCAMCCVDSSSWTGSYELFDNLRELISYCKPKEILVQGGEILIQNDTLGWLSILKNENPQLKISLVSNGNANITMLNTAENLFNRITFSIVGFQPETYHRIMNIRFGKTIEFIENLLIRGKVKVYLKYLLTPINLHEVNLFLSWAISHNPDRIAFTGSGINQYIKKDTFDNYWRIIFSRTATKIKKILIDQLETLRSNKINIYLDAETRIIFKISDDFISSNNLSNIINWH